MTTNAEVELQLAHRLREFVRESGVQPAGYQCEVHLHRGLRKKRRDAEFAANWDPDADSIRIAFSPLEEEVEIATDEVTESSQMANAGDVAEQRLSDLVRALDRAEGRPGYEFVSLKWFRDTALLHDAIVWAVDETARRDVLRDAIDRRWLLTS